MRRFEFFLARELGMTHGELLVRMTGHEFASWIAYYKLEADEREKAQQRAEDQGRARSMAGRMRR
jgi:hypothetical protein